MDAEKIAEVFDAVTPPKLGRIWWAADTPQEAERWQADYLAKGASNVELKPRDDAYFLSSFAAIRLLLSSQHTCAAVSEEMVKYPG